jgi:V/A-type H+/Na+-transporting ATPase subunit I
MPSPGERASVAMSRVALVAPRTRLRAMLVVLADAGAVQFAGPVGAAHGEAVEALRRLEGGRPPAGPGVGPPAARVGGAGGAAGRTGPRLLAQPRPVRELERSGARDLLAGEVELARREAAAVAHGGAAVLVGWAPRAELPALATALAAAGAAVVELPRPPLADPPTLLRTRGPARRFAPLVATYGAPRYADLDPTPFAAVSFALMFGMMFGDAGHGLLLAALGLALRRAAGPPGAPRRPRLAPLRPLWPFAVAGGLVATVFGLLYGEAFGPTGLVPVLWLAPLDHPLTLLGAGVAVGAVLLAVSFAIGTANRARESGWQAALHASSGIAGVLVFAAAGLAALGAATGATLTFAVAAVVAAAGIVLLFGGFRAEAGRSGAAVAQALVELVDAVVRLGANLISFTRLAAFGLMHAALGAIVLDGARSLWRGGPAAFAAGVVLFAAGNALAFALEALVAGVQAMRLEYYELFSRIFAGEGEPFTPWRIPVSGRGAPA